METISTNVTEMEHAGMRLFASRTGARDLVTLTGSIYGGWNMLPESKNSVPSLAAELMDAGTSKKTRDQIRGALAERGASLSFSAGGDRFYFSGSCLPEDIAFLLKMIVECLSDATFPGAELKSAKERSIAELEEAKNETRILASAALSRMLYDAKHVNYTDTLAVQKKKVESVTRADLLGFRKMLGQQGLIFAITGDVQPREALEEAKKIFAKLPKGTLTAPEKVPNKKKQESSEQTISVSDKANIDVYLGVAVPMTYDDALYVPFSVMSEMLGGRGFTSHLMSTIRERDGLTYGVYTMLSGFADKADGSFRVWATFSPQKYRESVVMLRKEIALFFNEHLTQDGLDARKIEMKGGYKVGLSTSRGLASILHRIGSEGKQLSYIDEYPDLIDAVTLEDLHKAAALIDLKNLSLAAAGTFVGKEDRHKTVSKK